MECQTLDAGRARDFFSAPASLKNCEFMRDMGSIISLYGRYWTEIKAR